METARRPVIVLAGGKSTRLGRDKASELLAGRTLLQRVIDACAPIATHFVLVKARGQQLPTIAIDVPAVEVEDAYTETGPLGGLYTGLSSLPPGTKALVVACDMPLLQPALLRELLRRSPDYDAVVPMRDGLPEPLCAVYSTTCVPPARARLERGAYKVAGLLDDVTTMLVTEAEWLPFDPGALSFLNVNRNEDLQRAREAIGRLGG